MIEIVLIIAAIVAVSSGSASFCRCDNDAVCDYTKSACRNLWVIGISVD